MTSFEAPPLPVREAYARWAPTYDEGSVLLKLDEIAAARLAPAGAQTRLLDAGCGTGHRLPASDGVGIDLVFEMLATGRRRRGCVRLAAGDLNALPFASGVFDLAWCRLSLGYVARLDTVYTELSRVCRTGGFVLVTDFHPEAAERGHERGFRDKEGSWRRVDCVLHDAEAHESAARGAGLSVDARLDLRAGPETRALFEGAGEAGRYARLEGLAVLLAYRFRKESPASTGC